jgi:hypothetical protein
MVYEYQHADSKEALEIEKLRLEAEKLKIETAKLRRDRTFVPLTFAAQVFNALCIILAGVIVLNFFQRPQLEQMEAARISNERLQLENHVISIQKYENANDKINAYKILADQWPQYSFLSNMVKNEQALLEAKKIIEANCRELASRLKKLDEAKIDTSKMTSAYRAAASALIDVHQEFIKSQRESINSLREENNCKD